jgi:hypothetical protein
LRKAVQNLQIGLWPAFKNGRRYAAGFSELLIRNMYNGFENRQDWAVFLSFFFGSALRNLLFKWSRGLSPPAFESLGE